LENWFSTELTNKKRDYIRNIIQKMSKEKQSERTITPKTNPKEKVDTCKTINHSELSTENLKIKLNGNIHHEDSLVQDEAKSKVKKYKTESSHTECLRPTLSSQSTKSIGSTKQKDPEKTKKIIDQLKL